MKCGVLSVWKKSKCMKSKLDKKSYLNGGRPRKWKYHGVKRPVSVRLTDGEKLMIKEKFKSLQAFIEKAMEVLL